MTKQSNFEYVPFSRPGRAARTWLVQKALKGMKVAATSLNWITLSSTLGHGVSVLASDRLPFLGYATPLAIRRAGRLMATTGPFPAGILSWLGIVGLKRTCDQKLSSGLLLTFTSPLPISFADTERYCQFTLTFFRTCEN